MLLSYSLVARSALSVIVMVSAVARLGASTIVPFDPSSISVQTNVQIVSSGIDGGTTIVAGSGTFSTLAFQSVSDSGCGTAAASISSAGLVNAEALSNNIFCSGGADAQGNAIWQGTVINTQADLSTYDVRFYIDSGTVSIQTAGQQGTNSAGLNIDMNIFAGSAGLQAQIGGDLYNPQGGISLSSLSTPEPLVGFPGWQESVDSTNGIVTDTFPAFSFDVPITVNPGQNLTIELAVYTNTSAAAPGFSSASLGDPANPNSGIRAEVSLPGGTIPEPSTFASLLIGTTVVIGLCGWRSPRPRHLLSAAYRLIPIQRLDGLHIRHGKVRPSS